ncbi:hypothetical protein M0811_02509 [Anaeramoeba ignava]|uniref:PRELI/MSF1 domain-containing protein n=1 Tax=Anaeramoeba ignava TaxID=1746090 RepID=A0A9Q0L907_ANAIG|nr:hypothetical protein M0811_02509 [Anaeramoeba ignava]
MSKSCFQYTFSIPFQKISDRYMQSSKDFWPKSISVEILETCKEGNLIFIRRKFEFENEGLPKFVKMFIKTNTSIFLEDCLLDKKKKNLTVIVRNGSFRQFFTLHGKSIYFPDPENQKTKTKLVDIGTISTSVSGIFANKIKNFGTDMYKESVQNKILQVENVLSGKKSTKLANEMDYLLIKSKNDELKIPKIDDKIPNSKCAQKLNVSVEKILETNQPKEKSEKQQENNSQTKEKSGFLSNLWKKFGF